MKIIIGADHAGFELKEKIKKYLEELGHKVNDLGTNSTAPVDYPLIAENVAKEVAKEKSKGILMCGSGIGMSISANKVKGIRAALCYDEKSAQLSREHNDANILCMGGRLTNEKTAKKITKTWLETNASSEERHKRRVKEMNNLD